MKKLAIIIFVFYALQNFAQTNKNNFVEVKTSKLAIREKFTEHGKFLYCNKDGFTVSRGGKKGLFLMKYDNNMNKKFENEISLGECSLKYFIYINKHIYVVYSRANLKIKKLNLYLQSIDKSTLTLNNDEKLLSSISYVPGPYNFIYTDKSISHDSSKVLIYRTPVDASRQRRKFILNVFNNKMKELWKDEIIIPNNIKKFKIKGVKLSNKGFVYLYGAIPQANAEKRSGKHENKYYAFIIGKSNYFKKIEIRLKNKLITDMKINILDDGNIISYGFYSELNEINNYDGSSSIKGCYYIKMNPTTNQVIKKETYEFDLDFITKLLPEKEIKKINKSISKGKAVEMSHYKLRKLLLNKDGSVVLLGEQYYSSSGEYGSRYYFNNIIVVKINSGGEIDWKVKIPKLQVSGSSGFDLLGYALFKNDDKLCFIFHDHPKNLLKPDSDKRIYQVINRGHIATLATVNMKGEMEMKKLLDHVTLKAFSEIATAQQLSDNELYIYFKGDGYKQLFGRIKF